MINYNAILELAVRLEPELADQLVDRFVDHAASVSPDSHGQVVITLTVAADSARHAVLQVLALVGDVAPLVAIEVLPTSAYDNRLGLGDLEEVLSVSETAEELQISAQAVRQRLEAGTLAGRKAGRNWHIPRQTVEAAKVRQQKGTRTRRTAPSGPALAEAIGRRGYPDPLGADTAAAILAKWGLPGTDLGPGPVALSVLGERLAGQKVSAYAAEHDLPEFVTTPGADS